MGNFDLKKNLLGIIALATSAVSFILAILGTTLTCSCSASKIYDEDNSKFEYSLSAVFVLSIIAMVFAIGAIVVAILELAKNRTSMIAKVALGVAVFALLYAFLPLVTMCSYNCMLTHYREAQL